MKTKLSIITNGKMYIKSFDKNFMGYDILCFTDEDGYAIYEIYLLDYHHHYIINSDIDGYIYEEEYRIYDKNKNIDENMLIGLKFDMRIL